MAVPALADLTPRQQEVAELVARRLTTKHIATRLGITPRRVQVHIASIAFTLSVPPEYDERIELYRWWWEATTTRPASSSRGQPFA